MRRSLTPPAARSERLSDSWTRGGRRGQESVRQRARHGILVILVRLIDAHDKIYYSEDAFSDYDGTKW